MRSEFERPLVSIIIPSFNQGRFIRKTLESIIEQDYRPLEILVVDGASTDETVSVLREFSHRPELKWVSEPDSGVVDAVNKGFERATGVIAAIQSSDDFYLPGAVTAAVQALQADPSLAFIFGDIQKVDSAGIELSRSELGPFSLEDILALRTWIPQPSTFFRLKLAKELGGWRESVPYAADTDLWFRMAFQAPAVKLNRLMAGRRMHDAQRDKQGARITRDYHRMMAELHPHYASSPNLRRAAKAGCLRIASHYSPGGRVLEWTRGLQVAALDPQSLSKTGWMHLVPYGFLAHRFLARAKRILIGRSGALR
jgi:glycosyltransferase involved in cell wall biosynthesis